MDFRAIWKVSDKVKLIFTRKIFSNQSGVALISVMLLLAILVTLIAYMLESQYLIIRQTSLVADDEKSYLENMQLESWAINLLKKEKVVAEIKEKFNRDVLTESWAEEKFDQKEGAISKSAYLIDLQGRFNINNLVQGRQQSWYNVFKRLLTVLEIDPNLTDSIVDWIDEDGNPISANGAEDLDYLSQSPPSRTANQRISTTDELLNIKGITPEIFRVLAPHISAINDDNVKVNMNTATLEILKALLPNGQAGGAEQFVELRSNGFDSIEQVLQSDALAGSGDSLKSLIDVKSQYFEMNGLVKLNDSEKHFKSGIRRELIDGKLKLAVFYRKREL